MSAGSRRVGSGAGAARREPERRARRPRAIPGGLRAAEVADVAEVPLLAAMRPEPMLAERLEQGGLRLRRRSPARRGRPAGARVAAAPDRGAGGVNDSLIERVRERLAAESAPLRPTVVAAAIRAESGGVLGDTEVPTTCASWRPNSPGPASSSRCCGPRAPPTSSSPPPTRCGSTTAPDCAAPRCGSPTRPRCPARPAAGGRRRPPPRRRPAVGGRSTQRGRLRTVHRPAARGAAARRRRRHLPVAAGPAAQAAQDLAALAAAAITPRRRACWPTSSPRGWPFWCRGTGAGKTTLLSAALGAVAPHERIVCVEDAPVGAAAPAPGPAGGPHRQRRGRRRDHGASTGPAGTANAAGPDRRR